MDDQARAAFIIAQAACCNAEVAGMQAENQQRMSLGHSIAYGEEEFSAVPGKYGLWHNDVIAYLSNGR